jgi:hypothetical protein
MQSVANVLQEAQEVLENDGWIKGNFSHLQGSRWQFCAAGAIDAVNYAKSFEAIRLLSDVICEQFPDRRLGGSINPLSIVTSFNDNLKTTKEDVISVFEKAQVRALEVIG